MRYHAVAADARRGGRVCAGTGGGKGGGGYSAVRGQAGSAIAAYIWGEDCGGGKGGF